MTTNGITKIEMEAMNAIIAISHHLHGIEEQMKKQNELLEKQNELLEDQKISLERINDTLKYRR
jgi:uncharacterized protein YoxC